MEDKVGAVVSRGPESWQFFAFVFAAVTSFGLSLVEDLVAAPLTRALTKAIWFFLASYLFLVNVRVRNSLVQILGRFKEEKH